MNVMFAKDSIELQFSLSCVELVGGNYSVGKY